MPNHLPPLDPLELNRYLIVCSLYVLACVLLWDWGSRWLGLTTPTLSAIIHYGIWETSWFAPMAFATIAHLIFYR